MKYSKAASIITGITEAVCAILSLLCILGIVLLSVKGAGFEYSLRSFDIAGFSLEASEGSFLTRGMIILALVAGFIAMALNTMIFRNLRLIVRTAMGKTSFSKGETPFQDDNVRMVREIGWFAVLSPLLQFVVSAVGRIVFSPMCEVSVNLTGFVMGIACLYLSQIFVYGATLEKDVDGLI